MAKKENIKKKKKDKSSALTGAGPLTQNIPNIPPTMAGIPNIPPTNGMPGGTPIGNNSLDRGAMTADQLTQAQIEQAIKESQDPSGKLKKLRSPMRPRSCLLNLLILVVLSVAIILLVCYIMLDKETFNLWFVIKDIFDKFGITNFFTNIGAWFSKVFGGNKSVLLMNFLYM